MEADKNEGSILNRKPPSILYHYCSTETFSAIVKGMTLRLSELSVSNDAMEGRLAMKALIDICLRKKMPLEFIDLLRNKKEFEDHWLGSSLGLCLSTEGDLLSQWRGYADDGSGFSIGFSTKFLTSIAQPIPVAYTEREHIEKIEIVAEKVEKMWSIDLQKNLALPGSKAGEFFRDRAVLQSDGSLQTSEPELEYLEFYNQLFELSTVGFELKGSAFSEEKEWRLLMSTERKESHGFARDKIAPYASYSITPEDFSHVIIGPNNRTPPAVIRSLIRRDLNVTRSEATYRS